MRIRAVDGAEAGDLLRALMALSAELAEAPQWSESVWSENVATLGERRVLVVAEEAGLLSGFVLAAMVADEAEIESIAVRPTEQRCGVGRGLVRELVGWLQTREVKRLRLEVRESNQRARDFYRAVGFGEIGRRAKYYERPQEDAVLLEILLARVGGV